MMGYNCAVNTWVMLGTCRVESIQLPSALILRRKETRRGAWDHPSVGGSECSGGLDRVSTVSIHIYIYSFKILYI